MHKEQIRQRARQLVSQLHTQCRASEDSLSLTASLGVACYPQDGKDSCHPVQPCGYGHL